MFGDPRGGIVAQFEDGDGRPDLGWVLVDFALDEILCCGERILEAPLGVRHRLFFDFLLECRAAAKHLIARSLLWGFAMLLVVVDRAVRLEGGAPRYDDGLVVVDGGEGDLDDRTTLLPRGIVGAPCSVGGGNGRA